jgi:hypothetical protein
MLCRMEAGYERLPNEAWIDVEKGATGEQARSPHYPAINALGGTSVADRLVHPSHHSAHVCGLGASQGEGGKDGKASGDEKKAEADPDAPPPLTTKQLLTILKVCLNPCRYLSIDVIALRVMDYGHPCYPSLSRAAV